MDVIFVIIIRTLILYALVVLALRIMGKREIGQLQPFDLVILLMISELAAIPSENLEIPLLAGVIPIIVLAIISLLLSVIEMKSRRLREILNGTPSVLIQDGKIIENELLRNRFSLTDLLEELRIGNVPNIADVELAILETNGKVSILPKALKRAVTPEDLKLQPPQEGLPFILIKDGKVDVIALDQASKDMRWLEHELKRKQISHPEEVLLASLDSSGKLFIQAKRKSVHYDKHPNKNQ